MEPASVIHPASLIAWTRRFCLDLVGQLCGTPIWMYIHLRCLGGTWYGAVPAIYLASFRGWRFIHSLVLI
jgi:hypothetical protein